MKYTTKFNENTEQQLIDVPRRRQHIPAYR